MQPYTRQDKYSQDPSSASATGSKLHASASVHPNVTSSGKVTTKPSSLKVTPAESTCCTLNVHEVKPVTVNWAKRTRPPSPAKASGEESGAMNHVPPTGSSNTNPSPDSNASNDAPMPARFSAAEPSPDSEPMVNQLSYTKSG